MKIVDMADEVHRELGSPTSLSIPAIAFWLRTNIGNMNNNLNTTYDVNITSFEIEDQSGNQITQYEVAVLKKMYHIHYYDGKLRDVLNSATTDSVVRLASDGSSIQKINKNEQAKTYLNLRSILSKELSDTISNYKNRDVQPLQVAGDDTVAATSSPNREYVRIRKY
jgi:hypothetical protein